ncbi:hypothetical protein CXF86_12860 [Shewanella sp. GutCb]|uniref:hypothetical protein n=1 Tax=Shewanella sp. GutCb TaxID=2058315 RepID=UPI000C79BCFF|nr:hypothetical protein [Shewanella sp. GutCb]PKG74396.1 hypothetical protein CXF86_12860 [Shewanella sp. GutCb]
MKQLLVRLFTVILLVSNSAWAGNAVSQQHLRFVAPPLWAVSNVSVGVGWGSGWNSNFNDPWRWNVGVSNGWYSYPYRGRYYRPGWGHYGSRWGYNRNQYTSPYRYQQPVYRQAEAKVISPPERVTTSVSYATGLTHLPENARVVQKDGHTVYEWQGVEYVFDWNSKTYNKVD